jgi:iron complex transport system substrate-binding protein
MGWTPRAVRAALAGLGLLSLFLVGCRREGRSATVGLRVVSLSPSTTEALAAIGAGDALVGRSRYCDYPPDVLTVPEVGGFVDPNFEAIVALRPDLVTGARGPAGAQMADRLGGLGIGTYFPETESLSAIDAMILGLGARTQHEASAERVVLEVHAREAAVRSAASALPKARTLLVFGIVPIVVAGPGSFADEMLAAAGGTNVVTEGGSYPTLGMERVLALAPDVLVDASMQESRGSERITNESPGWRELRAVKTGRVISLRDEAVLRPGPRVGEGILALAQAIHPGLSLPGP